MSSDQDSDSLRQFEEQFTDETIRELGVGKLIRLLDQMADNFPDGYELTDEERRPLLCLLRILQRGERLLQAEKEFFLTKLKILARSGQTAEAVRLGRQAYATDPNWFTAIGTANALRRAGDLSGAVEMFRAATRHKPDDFASRLDVGDLSIMLGRWQEALDSYEEVLKIQPNQAWAVPSAFYCRYRLTGDKEWLRKLRALAAEPDDESSERAALAKHLGERYFNADRQRARALLDECAES